MEKIKLYLSSLSTRQKYAYVLVFFVLIGGWMFFHSSPSNFPVGTIVNIRPGESLQTITENLYDAHVIRWQFVFRTTVILLGGEKRVIAGDYLLDNPAGPVDLAYRLVAGKFHLAVVKLTIPEGWNVFQIGALLEKNIKDFDVVRFLALAKNEEGYLFPDTYFVSPVITPENMIVMMKANFVNKISGLQKSISRSGHTEKEIITMASIIEAEARTTESRKIVSGILWKRLASGMPLQVDATFMYINGKNTYELTASDLKIDSPYNTYKYKGLPPGPIGNPGIDSITATLEPTATKYLYYLSSKDGTMHYATTFADHVKNKQLYLNN